MSKGAQRAIVLIGLVDPRLSDIRAKAFDSRMLSPLYRSHWCYRDKQKYCITSSFLTVCGGVSQKWNPTGSVLVSTKMRDPSCPIGRGSPGFTEWGSETGIRCSFCVYHRVHQFTRTCPQQILLLTPPGLSGVTH